MNFIEAVTRISTLQAESKGLRLMMQRENQASRRIRELTVESHKVFVNGDAPQLADVLSNDWR